jgi:selenocysteine lyase/cysteine desulfurase
VTALTPARVLVGDEIEVPCVDGVSRRYLSLDSAASTAALPSVVQRVAEFMPWYSSVHRGAGYKSQMATAAYEDARRAALRFAGRGENDDIAIICRNATEAINHLAYRLRLTEADSVVSTVAEHHANLLPWSRTRAAIRHVECDRAGTFTVDAVTEVLDQGPAPRLLAITGATNVTGWLPPIDEIIDAAHARGVLVAVDAAQLAPHRPMPAGADFIAWSGHKMYAPYGAGVLIGPRTAFVDGDPFLAGGGAVDLVDLDEVVWTDPPEREEAGSPNVVGAVALGAAIEDLSDLGWDHLIEHERRVARRLRVGVDAMPGVHLLGPSPDVETLAIATFVVDEVPHALVAARLSAEFGIGVRHGCFCAHPYLIRLLGLSESEIGQYRQSVLSGDRRNIPGAVRASGGISVSGEDVDRFLDALAVIADGSPPPIQYHQNPVTGDFWPDGPAAPWSTADGDVGAPCAPG